MGLLKPGFLENATSAADVQKLMKADLRNGIGKKGLKFIAAKNCVIGGKKINLFILTSTPAPFEAILKAKHPKAYRAKGTCEIVKNKETGGTQVTIKTSTGQILPDAVAKLMPLVVGNDKNFVASYPKPTDKLGDKPALKPTGKVETGGVAEWAQQKYRIKAKRTVIASMTSDGKIGSVYFNDGSRIRTTHGVGPAKEQHDKTRSMQFNVDESEAEKEYVKAGNTGMDFDTWLKQRLLGINPTNAPKWAKIIDSPDSAHDRATTGNPSGRETLIEIFKSISGQYEGWHPSRGTATKFETDKQTISVLQAAIKHVDAKYPKPNDHEQLDPAIVERRRVLQESVQRQRNNPNPGNLKTLWEDQVIAERLQVLGLTKPTIDQLDQDKTINRRINQIFTKHLKQTLTTDKHIQKRLKEIQATRKLRNQEFYEFVRSRLPQSELVKAMRDPKTV